MKEKFTFFWKKNSPFSQWFPCHFTINGIEYNCAEQFMMASKARLFDDKETEEKIMNSSDPKEQKKLGKKVAGFSAEEWMEFAEQFVYDGNYAKFTQNPNLKKILLDTEGTTLVEASPFDTIWGIGLDANDPKAYNRNTWQGSNLLGKILTELRQDLIATDVLKE